MQKCQTLVLFFVMYNSKQRVVKKQQQQQTHSGVCGLPGHLLFRSLSVGACVFKMYQIVFDRPNILPMSIILYFNP